MFACVTQVYGYDTVFLVLSYELKISERLTTMNSRLKTKNYSLLKLLTGFANAALMD